MAEVQAENSLGGCGGFLNHESSPIFTNLVGLGCGFSDHGKSRRERVIFLQEESVKICA
ncbi:MAG: hypothetical protein ACI9NQ_000362 [Paracoccaceae bacterium]|jgi:hypothetical protein